MITSAFIRGTLLSLATFAFALGLSACGEVSNTSAPTSTAVGPPASALSELDSLEVPAGVDAALFSELKEALRHALGTAAKFASAPPAGMANRVTDLTLTDGGGGTYTLTWRYRNLGDYDQNGTVGISDITPIAVHFGQNADAGNEWIDGGGNGAVDISDITPLAVNFGANCAAYVIETSESQDGVYAEVESVPFSSAAGDGRKGFSHTLSLPPGVWVRVVPADSGDAKSTDIGSNPARVPGAGEELPVAAIAAEPGSGEAPLAVDFDASGSFDPDGGSIGKYEWDWQGDGTYDEDTGANPLAAHTYDSAGTFAAKVRVTDDEATASVASQTITVASPGVNEPPVAVIGTDTTEGEAPLYVYFWGWDSHDLDGDIVKYEWDFEGSGTWVETEYGNEGEYTYNSAGIYQAALRVTDDEGATGTDTVTITVSGGGDPPVAQLDADPTSGDPPLVVDFDAGGSHDPDGGSIVKYEWDWNGDGTYDHDSGTTPTAQHTYSTDGTYPARVRVTDDEFTTATATAVITVGAGGTARGDWWMFGREPAHNRRSPFVGAQADDVKWQFDTGGVVDSSPAIAADGTIYFGSFDEYIYAVKPDGNQKWRYGTDGNIRSSPAIAEDGTVYVGCDDNYLYAITPDGNLKWRYQTGDWVTSSPAIGSDGTIYVGSDDQYLYAITDDETEGTLKWRYQTGGYVWSSPAIGADGTIYVGSNDHYLYAVTPAGGFKWQYETGGCVTSSPAIGSDGTIYVGSWDGYLYAINPGGSFKWRYETGDDVESSPGVGADGTIYVGSDDDYLYAINPNGSFKWKEEVIGDLWSSSPSIGADGTIYLSSYSVLTENIWITALDSGGNFKWRYNKEDASLLSDSSAAIGPDGTVYIGCGADLFAFAD
jgi:outer membrane protein assembly factor BamB